MTAVAQAQGPREPVCAFVALGANLGDARAMVRDAAQSLAGIRATTLVRVSPLYRTAPWQASGPDFINAVAEVRTALSAPDLLTELQALEAAAGRQRPYPNAPRTLDLDLLFYGDATMASPRLTLPHPRWRERAFVLVPLVAIAPGRVPAAALQAVADQAIERCTDE